MRNIEWFDDDDDDDFDEEEDSTYVLFWPGTGGNENGWISRRHIGVDAHEDEAYIYWEAEMDGVTKAFMAARIAGLAWANVQDAIWYYATDVVHPEYSE